MYRVVLAVLIVAAAFAPQCARADVSVALGSAQLTPATIGDVNFSACFGHATGLTVDLRGLRAPGSYVPSGIALTATLRRGIGLHQSVEFTAGGAPFGPMALNARYRITI